MAMVYFDGVRVENVTNCGITIHPCGIYIPSGGYKKSVRCNSDGVYADLYKTFYRWNTSAMLNPGDVGVFSVCNAKEVKLVIMRRCPNCLKTYELVLSAQV